MCEISTGDVMRDGGVVRDGSTGGGKRGRRRKNLLLGRKPIGKRGSPLALKQRFW